MKMFGWVQEKPDSTFMMENHLIHIRNLNLQSIKFTSIKYLIYYEKHVYPCRLHDNLQQYKITKPKLPIKNIIISIVIIHTYILKNSFKFNKIATRKKSVRISGF